MHKEPFLVWNNGACHEPADKWVNYVNTAGIETIIVKVGTNIITHEEPSRMDYAMRCIAEDMRELLRKGYDVKLVTSGACGLGREFRKKVLKEVIPAAEKDSKPQKQRDALFGQHNLFSLWRAHFFPQPVYESLIVHADITDEARRKRLLRDYQLLRQRGVIPVINEDDARSTEELPDPGEKAFSDNDGLASLIARYMNNGKKNVLLVLLTDVYGVYSKESFKRGIREVIDVVKDAAGLESQALEEKTADEIVRRGGIASKINAASAASAEGVYAVIASGQYWKFDDAYQQRVAGAERGYKPVHAILEGRAVGTRFVPQNDK